MKNVRSEQDLQAIQTSVAFKNISDAVEQYRRQFAIAFLALIAFSAIHVGLVVVANLYTLETRVQGGKLSAARDTNAKPQTSPTKGGSGTRHLLETSQAAPRVKPVAVGSSQQLTDLSYIMSNLDEAEQKEYLSAMSAVDFIDRNGNYRKYTVTGFELGGHKRSDLKLYTSVGHVLAYVRGKGLQVFTENSCNFTDLLHQFRDVTGELVRDALQEEAGQSKESPTRRRLLSPERRSLQNQTWYTNVVENEVGIEAFSSDECMQEAIAKVFNSFETGGAGLAAIALASASQELTDKFESCYMEQGGNFGDDNEYYHAAGVKQYAAHYLTEFISHIDNGPYSGQILPQFGENEFCFYSAYSGGVVSAGQCDFEVDYKKIGKAWDDSDNALREEAWEGWEECVEDIEKFHMKQVFESQQQGNFANYVSSLQNETITRLNSVKAQLEVILEQGLLGQMDVLIEGTYNGAKNQVCIDGNTCVDVPAADSCAGCGGIDGAGYFGLEGQELASFKTAMGEIMDLAIGIFDTQVTNCFGHNAAVVMLKMKPVLQTALNWINEDGALAEALNDMMKRRHRAEMKSLQLEQEMSTAVVPGCKKEAYACWFMHAKTDVIQHWNTQIMEAWDNDLGFSGQPFMLTESMFPPDCMPEVLYDEDDYGADAFQTYLRQTTSVYQRADAPGVLHAINSCYECLDIVTNITNWCDSEEYLSAEEYDHLARGAPLGSEEFSCDMLDQAISSFSPLRIVMHPSGSQMYVYFLGQPFESTSSELGSGSAGTQCLMGSVDMETCRLANNWLSTMTSFSGGGGGGMEARRHPLGAAPGGGADLLDWTAAPATWLPPGCQLVNFDTGKGYVWNGSPDYGSEGVTPPSCADGNSHANPYSCLCSVDIHNIFTSFGDQYFEQCRPCRDPQSGDPLSECSSMSVFEHFAQMQEFTWMQDQEDYAEQRAMQNAFEAEEAAFSVRMAAAGYDPENDIQRAEFFLNEVVTVHIDDIIQEVNTVYDQLTTGNLWKTFKEKGEHDQVGLGTFMGEFGCSNEYLTDLEELNTRISILGVDACQIMCYQSECKIPRYGTDQVFEFRKPFMAGIFFSQLLGGFENYSLYLPFAYCSTLANRVFAGEGLDEGSKIGMEFVTMLHGWGGSSTFLHMSSAVIYFANTGISSGTSRDAGALFLACNYPEDMSENCNMAMAPGGYLIIAPDGAACPLALKTWWANGDFAGFIADYVTFELPVFLVGNMNVNPAKLGMFGFSMGSYGTLNVATLYPESIHAFGAFNGPVYPGDCFFMNNCHHLCSTDVTMCELEFTTIGMSMNAYVIVFANSLVISMGSMDPVGVGVANHMMQMANMLNSLQLTVNTEEGPMPLNFPNIIQCGSKLTAAGWAQSDDGNYGEKEYTYFATGWEDLTNYGQISACSFQKWSKEDEEDCDTFMDASKLKEKTAYGFAGAGATESVRLTLQSMYSDFGFEDAGYYCGDTCYGPLNPQVTAASYEFYPAQADSGPACQGSMTESEAVAACNSDPACWEIWSGDCSSSWKTCVAPGANLNAAMRHLSQSYQAGGPCVKFKPEAGAGDLPTMESGGAGVCPMSACSTFSWCVEPDLTAGDGMYLQPVPAMVASSKFVPASNPASGTFGNMQIPGTTVPSAYAKFSISSPLMKFFYNPEQYNQYPVLLYMHCSQNDEFDLFEPHMQYADMLIYNGELDGKMNNQGFFAIDFLDCDWHRFSEADMQRSIFWFSDAFRTYSGNIWGFSGFFDFDSLDTNKFSLCFLSAYGYMPSYGSGSLSYGDADQEFADVKLALYCPAFEAELDNPFYEYVFNMDWEGHGGAHLFKMYLEDDWNYAHSFNEHSVSHGSIQEVHAAIEQVLATTSRCETDMDGKMDSGISESRWKQNKEGTADVCGSDFYLGSTSEDDCWNQFDNAWTTWETNGGTPPDEQMCNKQIYNEYCRHFAFGCGAEDYASFK